MLLARKTFGAMLESAVAWANLPSAEAAPDAAEARGAYLLWVLREESPVLHVAWRKFLTAISDSRPSPHQLRQLRAQCTAWAGRIVIGAAEVPALTAAEVAARVEPAGAPLVWDEEGEARIGYFEAAAETYLALLGAQLLGSKPEFRVRRCGAAPCARFFVLPLTHRGQGKPYTTCPRHRAKQDKNSTPRVRRCREREKELAARLQRRRR